MDKGKAKSSLGAVIVNLVAFNAAISFPVYAVKASFIPSFLPLQDFINWNFDTQLALVSKAGLYIALFIFVNILSIIGGRGLLSKLEPAKFEDKGYLKIMNQVLRNTVEQTLIFLPNYLYWIINVSTKEDIKFAQLIFFIFLAGRILFLLGYAVGIVTGTTRLRIVGMAWTIAANSILILRNFGINLI